ERLVCNGREILLEEYLATIEHQLQDYNYCLKVLDAKYYGANQSRLRSILVFVRKDIRNGRKIDFHPAPKAVNLLNQSVDALMPWVESFSPGQFGELIDGKRVFKFKSAIGKVFCTITASV